MNIENQLIEIRDLIQKVFGAGQWVAFTVRDKGSIDINLHEAGTYVQATETLRKLGIGKRNKRVIQTGESYWSIAYGDIAPGITVTAFCSDIPSTCHVEKYTEKIPKQQTIDTGQFVEVERIRVVCGGKEDA